MMTAGNKAFLSTVGILAASLAAAKVSERRVPEYLASPLSTIQKELAGWEMTEALQSTGRSVERLKPTEILSRTYAKQSANLNLFVAYYAQQRAGETMHSPKQCLPGNGWEIWQQDSAEVDWNGGRVRINKYGVQKSGRRLLVFYWYQSRDRVIASEFQGKLLLMRDALVDQRTAAALVRITLPDDAGAAEEGLLFSRAVMEQLNTRLRGEPPVAWETRSLDSPPQPAISGKLAQSPTTREQ